MRCGSCRHVAHRGPCRRRGPSGCVPLGTGDGMTGFACGVRPQCPCSWRTCRCGAEVAVATCADDPDSEETIVRGSAGKPGGTLGVRKLPDGTLLARYLRPDEEPGPGEWRATDHDIVCPQAARRGVTVITGAT